jgi:EF hand domain-containing protein
MMRSKTLIAVAAASLLAAPLALAQYGSSGTGPAQMDKRSADERTPPKSDQDKSASGSVRGGASVSASEFRRMDKNKDGYLSKDEVEGNASLSSSFDQLDADHDGKLARSEVRGSASSGKRG